VVSLYDYAIELMQLYDIHMSWVEDMTHLSFMLLR